MKIMVLKTLFLKKKRIRINEVYKNIKISKNKDNSLIFVKKVKNIEKNKKKKT